jgi:hypothetical protein
MLCEPDYRPGQHHYHRGPGDHRRADHKSVKEGTACALLPLCSDASSQPHIKISRCGNRLKPANQLAEACALDAKIATGPARLDMPERWIAQTLVQLRLFNFLPRDAALLAIHDGTTWM